MNDDSDEIEFEDNESSKFEMTQEEVEYFLKSVSHEYLSKDTYYKSINLIRRMRKFLEQSQ